MRPSDPVGLQSNPNFQNQNSGYRLESDSAHQEAELQRQLMEDLRDLFDKKEAARTQVEGLKPDYRLKKGEYFESKDKLEEVLQHKQSVKDQMMGFLKMYEVKKEATLQQLSHRLQQSDNFKKQHVF